MTAPKAKAPPLPHSIGTTNVVPLRGSDNVMQQLLGIPPLSRTALRERGQFLARTGA
jgi:hypothetical protein